MASVHLKIIFILEYFFQKKHTFSDLLTKNKNKIEVEQYFFCKKSQNTVGQL